MVTHDEDFLKRAAAARARVNPVQAAELDDQIKDGAILIDVRDPAEVSAGTIRGSLNISLDQITQHLEARVPDRDSSIICFCRAGNRGALAAAALLDLGYRNVKSLAHGLEGVPDRLLQSAPTDSPGTDREQQPSPEQ